ncbi:MAG: tyrosine-type recombinase/integrase [Candidatus Bipolaricaulia bacterium]
MKPDFRHHPYEMILHRFLQSLKPDASPYTLKAYRGDVVGFFTRVPTKFVDEVDLEMLLDYKQELRGYHNSTIARVLSVVRSFFKFASRTGATALSPEEIDEILSSPKVNRRSPKEVLDETEVRMLLSAIDDPRDYLIFALGLKAGLRQGEIRNIRLKDFSMMNGRAFLTVQGKGNRERTIPIADDLFARVIEYMRRSEKSFQSPQDRESYLIESRKSRDDPRISPTHMVRIVRGYIEQVGIPKHITPHSLRHTCATNMALNGAPLQVIQNFLGHSSPDTSKIYIQKAEEIASQAIRYSSFEV